MSGLITVIESQVVVTVSRRRAYDFTLLAASERKAGTAADHCVSFCSYRFTGTIHFIGHRVLDLHCVVEQDCDAGFSRAVRQLRSTVGWLWLIGFILLRIAARLFMPRLSQSIYGLEQHGGKERYAVWSLTFQVLVKWVTLVTLRADRRGGCAMKRILWQCTYVWQIQGNLCDNVTVVWQSAHHGSCWTQLCDKTASNQKESGMKKRWMTHSRSWGERTRFLRNLSRTCGHGW